MNEDLSSSRDRVQQALDAFLKWLARGVVDDLMGQSSNSAYGAHAEKSSMENPPLLAPGGDDGRE